MSLKNQHYVLFIDESGNGSLNHQGQYFVLGCVIINKNDYEIIEGYLRLLKRKYLRDDMRIIHTTDLCERPYQKYRYLLKPKRIITHFVKDLRTTLASIPFETAFYFIRKF